MSTEKIIGQCASFEFVAPSDYGPDPGPVTVKECDALIHKIEQQRFRFLLGAGINPHEPNTVILSNRQWYALRRFAHVRDVRPDIKEPNIRGMNIIVDARGDYPNTPLVGHIEF